MREKKRHRDVVERERNPETEKVKRDKKSERQQGLKWRDRAQESKTGRDRDGKRRWQRDREGTETARVRRERHTEGTGTTREQRRGAWMNRGGSRTERRISGAALGSQALGASCWASRKGGPACSLSSPGVWSPGKGEQPPSSRSDWTPWTWNQNLLGGRARVPPPCLQQPKCSAPRTVPQRRGAPTPQPPCGRAQSTRCFNNHSCSRRSLALPGAPD